MKPLTSEITDQEMLRDLGRASVQIVHDLKNRLNGLKLYATFLRRRMEKSERPEDERETINKLIAELERAADDLTILVRYGRPLELRRRAGVALSQLVSALGSGEGTEAQLQLEMEDVSMEGEFDASALAEALQTITRGALRLRHGDAPIHIRLHREDAGGAAHALIEWRNIETSSPDVFRSFAGGEALRMSLAARIIEAHQGETEQQADALRVRLPLESK